MSVIEREQVQVDPVREGHAWVLEAAALEIEVRGWCQHTIEDGAGRVCADGAITAACFGEPDVSNAHTLAAHIFGFADAAILPGWNDEDGRTAEEVTFVLRWRAAEIRDGR